MEKKFDECQKADWNFCHQSSERLMPFAIIRGEGIEGGPLNLSIQYCGYEWEGLRSPPRFREGIVSTSLIVPEISGGKI